MDLEASVCCQGCRVLVCPMGCGPPAAGGSGDRLAQLELQQQGLEVRLRQMELASHHAPSPTQ